MVHLRKILKTLDYFLVKFELIPRIEVKWKFEKSYEIPKKKIDERLKTFLGNFKIH